MGLYTPALEIFLRGIFDSKGGLSRLVIFFLRGMFLGCHIQNQFFKCKTCSVAFILIVRANAGAKSINYAVHQSTSKLLHLPLGQPTLLATGWSVDQQCTDQQCCNSVISKSNRGTLPASVMSSHNQTNAV